MYHVCSSSNRIITRMTHSMQGQCTGTHFVSLANITVLLAIYKYIFRKKIKGEFLVFYHTWFDIASSATRQNPFCRKMLGLNQGLLRQIYIQLRRISFTKTKYHSLYCETNFMYIYLSGTKSMSMIRSCAANNATYEEQRKRVKRHVTQTSGAKVLGSLVYMVRAHGGGEDHWTTYIDVWPVTPCSLHAWLVAGCNTP